MVEFYILLQILLPLPYTLYLQYLTEPLLYLVQKRKKEFYRKYPIAESFKDFVAIRELS